jgi:folate-binding protein YgfZ
MSRNMGDLRSIQETYRAVHARGGLLARDDRTVIEVTGADRAAWLNNLVTNVVKTLSPGEGNYAFATNVKGRCVFDAGILVLDDRLWLDIDRRWAEPARKHLDRYIITEDVNLALLDGAVRFAVVGPGAGAFAARAGCGNFAPMAQWQHVAIHIDGAAARLVRNDFIGLPAADVVAVEPNAPGAAAPSGAPSTSAVPPASASLAASRALASELGFVELDRETAEVLRIEAGIPASVDDIDDDVVPPETGRIEQGISFHKGCYLGQEVIERMRAHNVLARKLVGLRLAGDAIPTRGQAVADAASGAEVGRITSACHSVALGAPLALGYVKTSCAAPGTRVSVVGPAGATAATVIALPLSPPD